MAFQSTISRSPARPERWEVAGRILGFASAAWLQVVGFVTATVSHHVVHALPILVLALAPRGRWTRHNAALAGFAWVLMLSLLTPMIHDVLRGGVRFSTRGLAYTWLAPGMVLISAAWSAVNLTLLARAPRRMPAYFAWLVALGAVFGWTQPAVWPLFDACIEGVMRGNPTSVAVLAGWAVVLLPIPWFLVLCLTARPRQPMSGVGWAWAAAYWVFFVGCMVVGLLPALN